MTSTAMQAGSPDAGADIGALPDIDDEAVRRFHEDGFLAVDRLTTDEEVAWLSDAWNELFADERTWFDVAYPFGRIDQVRVGQMLFPERRLPSLHETLAFRRARRIAARLLGLEAGILESWGHMVLKPAERGHATPWHQDESYWEPEFEYHAVGVWLPLEDVNGENGCMCFVPGSHRGELLAHRHVGDDPAVHLLELDEPADTSGAVEVPLRVGGATFHHPRTLHSTAPNRSPRPRRAWANEFQSPPRKRAAPITHPWQEAAKKVWAEREARRAGADSTGGRS